MARKSRLGTYTFKLEDDSIMLRSTLSNMEGLQNATGKDLHEFLTECKTQADMATLFYYMQWVPEGDEIMSRDDIYEVFFANVMELQNPEFQKQLQEATFTLMGLDYQTALVELDKGSKSKKSPAV